MKILILTNYGMGLYKFRKELIEKLVINNEVYISLPNGKFIDKLIDLGCKYIDTDFNRKGTSIFDDIKLFFFYIKTIKEIKPNVVLTYTIKPTVYGGMACQLTKTPYIVNITGTSAATERGGMLNIIATILYKLGLRKANKVFFQNEANRDYMLSKHLVSNNYDMIPGSGVNLKQYKVLEYPKDKYLKFVYIGRITEEKGIRLYLNAAEYIKDKYPKVTFGICGDYDEEDYKKRIENLEDKGVVEYYGVVDDMTTIYKKVQCIVHPTWYAEGMSNVLLESLASGRPIIATDRPGCKEIVDDGINGFVIKTKDEEDLINKLEKFILLSNEARKQLGLNGRKKVEKQFDRNIVVNKYLEEISKYE